MAPDLAFERWKRRAAEAGILDVALRPPIGAKLKKKGREYVGPCPACGGVDRFSVNPKKGVFNCRGAEGGDVIAMVRHVTRVDFRQACEIIVGEPPPAAESQVDQAQLAAQEAARAAAAARRSRSGSPARTPTANASDASPTTSTRMPARSRARPARAISRCAG
jgi:phage/plasmid primase-like uncharacterized protein